MVDPYRMIVVNLIASVILVVGLFIYKTIFKKRLNLFLLLIIISILPILSVFRTGVYESGDFVFHLYHVIDFSNALKEGVLIPSWSAGLNSSYGHPVFLFIYIIPYYALSILHLLGFTLIFSERLLLSTIFIGSGISMWFLLMKLTKNNLASFSGSILYVFAPYHLLDLHFRVAIAESTVFVFTPIILYLIIQAAKKTRLIYLVWLALLFGILFLTHPAMFVIYTGLFILYALFLLITKRANPRFMILFFGSIAVGMIINSFAWASRIFLTPLTQGSELINSEPSFVKPLELIWSPWRFGFLFQGSMGELTYTIGYPAIIVIIVAIYILLKKNKAKNNIDILFWVLIFASTIFIMLPYSKPVWQTLSFLNLMQFSYRFLHVIAFCTAILAAYLVLIFKKRENLIYLFLFLSIGYTILNWGNRGTIPQIDDKWIIKNLPNGTREGEKMIEATPLWWNVEKDFLTIPKNHLEIVNGNAEIKNFERKTTIHTYGVLAYEHTKLVENTLYFPDWEIKVNGKKVPVNYKTAQYNARMVFEVPKGVSFIEVKYSDIKQIKWAKRISAITFLILVFYLVLYYTSQMLKAFRKWHPRALKHS